MDRQHVAQDPDQDRQPEEIGQRVGRANPGPGRKHGDPSVAAVIGSVDHHGGHLPRRGRQDREEPGPRSSRARPRRPPDQQRRPILATDQVDAVRVGQVVFRIGVRLQASQVRGQPCRPSLLVGTAGIVQEQRVQPRDRRVPAREPLGKQDRGGHEADQRQDDRHGEPDDDLGEDRPDPDLHGRVSWGSSTSAQKR